MFCMAACSIMQNHPDSLVQAEAIRCLQQLHIFAPNVVNLTTLIPNLCNKLLSSHLILRKASVECLRQLAHREAKDICELGKKIVDNNEEVVKKMYISNRGLEGIIKVELSWNEFILIWKSILKRRLWYIIFEHNILMQ